MDKTKPMHNLLTDLIDDLGNPALMWQIAIIAFAVALGWLIWRGLRNRLPSGNGAWRYGVEGAYRMALPLVALGVVLLGRAVLARWYHGPLSALNVAVPLLASAALIRLAGYVLRHIFTPSSWLTTSERFIATAVWFVLALHLTGLLPEVMKALDDLSFKVGTQRLSVLTILSAVLAVVVTLLTALWTGSLIELRVMRAGALDMSLRIAAVKLIRAALIIVGVLVALPLAGIDVTVLSVFGGALGVGIGFGLQKIASNYASGFIILLERSIRIGDTLTVDNRQGEVVQLNTRYLVLKGGDGTEAIIPNDTLITSTVVNHSYTNRLARAGLPFSISYASPMEKAMEIMVDLAKRHPQVLPEPAPKAFVKNFLDNRIELELGVWIGNVQDGTLGLRSDLNLAIWRAFRENGIELFNTPPAAPPAAAVPPAKP